MRRSWILGLAVIVFAVAASTAAAASVHFKKGGEPTCTFSGTGTTSVSATCTGTLTGLSGADLSIPTTLSGFTVYTCSNKGQNPAPGQNRVPTGPSTTPNRVEGGSVKNGNVTYTATGGLTATSATAEQAGCPNNNWTATNPQLTVTDISEQIIQGGQVIFTCTASNPNGLSGTVSLSCN